MKKKTMRSAKTITSAAAARRPLRRSPSKTEAPKAARPKAKRKVAAKKKAVRRSPVRRAVRVVQVKPLVVETPPPVPPSLPAPKPAPPLKTSFPEITSPPPTLGSMVRLAQATQPLPTLPAEPGTPRRVTPSAPAPPPLPIPPILLEGDERTHPVVPGPVEKYVLSPTPPAEPPKVEVSELPEAYGTGKLFLTARDPHCLYAHWDLTEAQQRRYSGFAHHLALRVYLDNLHGERVTESVVEPGARHGFVHVGRAGAKYVAQLGCYQPGGEWLALAVSEPATTPPEAVAEDKTVHWAAVEPLVVTEAPAPPPAPAPAPPPAPAFHAEPVRPMPAPAPEAGRSVPERRGGFGGVSEPAFVAQGGPGRTAPPEPFRQVEPPSVPAPAIPAALPPVSYPPAWTPAQERLLTEMVEIALGQPRTVGSVELVERAQRRAWREVSVPAEQIGASLPFGVPLPLGGPASLPVPVESEVLGISSAPGAVPAGQERQFWFNVNVEVIVYGATEPTARVSLGGLPLRLRPDGTFSCRFALPDGRYELPAVAVSVDNDTRRADLSLGRRTEYHGEVGIHPQDKALRPPVPEHVQAAQTK